MKKKLFIKLYSESESKHLIPDSPRAASIIDGLERDEIKKIYIISSNRAFSWPYINIFRKYSSRIMVHDLIIDALDTRMIYTIKSIIDDINSSIQNDDSCEIIFFNGSLAGTVLACYYVNACRNAERAVAQVRKIIPTVALSGSAISFIEKFNDVLSSGARGPEKSYAQVKEGAGAARQEAGMLPADRVKAESSAVRKITEALYPAALIGLSNVLRRFRFGTKLVVLVALIVVFSLSLMIFLGTLFYRSDTEERAGRNNHAMAQFIASRMEDEIRAYLEKARNAAKISAVESSSEELDGRVRDILFHEKNNFIFMGIAERHGDELDFNKTFYNKRYIGAGRLSREDILEQHTRQARYFLQSFKHKLIIRNISPDMGMPVLGMSFPYEKSRDDVESVIVCYVPLERFIKAFRDMGQARAYMVSDRGDCVLDAERNRVLARINMMDMPIVKKMLAGTLSDGEMKYRDADGLDYIGSYKKLDTFGLGVIVTVAEHTVLREVYSIQRRNFIILAIVLIVAIIGAFLFSRTVSVPIDSLKELADSSQLGNLKLTASREGDEIYFLTNSFRQILNSYLEYQKAPRPPSHETRVEEERHAGMTESPEAPVPESMSQKFRAEGLKVQVTYAGPEVNMAWVGRANIANPGELLNPYLEGVITSLRGRELTCDFSSLETMNAATVQSIIRFAEALHENRIRAKFMYNKSIDWQDASFEALGAVIYNMDTISLDGRPMEKNVFIVQ